MLIPHTFRHVPDIRWSYVLQIFICRLPHRSPAAVCSRSPIRSLNEEPDPAQVELHGNAGAPSVLEVISPDLRRIESYLKRPGSSAEALQNRKA
jgi:hypothetical protein